MAVRGPQANRLLPLAVLAIALGGCSTDFSSINLNPLSANERQSAEYNYFYRREASSAGYVSPADLVGPDGRCAFAPGPAAPGGPEVIEAAVPSAPPPAASAPIDPKSNRALYFTAGPETGRQGASQQSAAPPSASLRGGIALSMTECQVVAAAGYTERVEISANERGQRVVKLTYLTGDRPGIYVFREGRLITMDRVEAPPAVKPQRPAKNAKAKPRQQ